jgi:enoyl-CoA hydratase/carnithine racemase
VTRPTLITGVDHRERDSLLSESVGEAVTVLTMSRPERLNAISVGLATELVRSLERHAADPNVAAVVLTGAGERAFGAGIDVREAATFSPQERDAQQEVMLRLQRTLSDYPLPTVAAVNGLAAGASLQLALHCDLIVAGAGAKFGMPELGAGLPCILGSWLLHQRVGPQIAADMVLSGRWLSAEEAVGTGLAARAVRAGDERSVAVAIAEEIASRKGEALTATHRWLRELRRGVAPRSLDGAIAAADEIIRVSNRSPLADPLDRGRSAAREDVR